MSDELNKDCAEALGWEWSQAEHGFMHLSDEHMDFCTVQGILVPDVICLREMHFHDSEDWVVLLENKVMRMSYQVISNKRRYLDMEEKMYEVFEITISSPDGLYVNYETDCYEKFISLKAKACLEVLNAN